MTYPELEALEQFLHDRHQTKKSHGNFDVHSQAIIDLFWAAELFARHLKETTKQKKRKKQ